MDALKYEVAIVGGGITGTALLYVLSKYTDVESIAIFEKYDAFAQVNSFRNNNSQTLHFGDIETNYTLEKAKKVKKASDLVARYVEKYAADAFKIFPKMVLAVGKEEVEILVERYDEFKELFPDMQKIGAKEIAKIEPNVTKGRNGEPLLALFTEKGYAVDYSALSESFVNEAKSSRKQIDIFLGEKIQHIEKHSSYLLSSSNRKIEARVVVVASGPHSLMFAKELGYGKEYAVLPVAGSFYCSPKLLNGKVYTMQEKKLPFAAVHGDPDIRNLEETRFGPTAKVLPMLERHRYATIFDFIKTYGFSVASVLSVLNILRDPVILKFILMNVVYDIPIVGRFAFMKWNVRKIVPSIRSGQLKKGRGLGGIRPQLIDTKTKKVLLGEAKIFGENIIFDITPSPGASVCLKNAENNARTVVKFLNRIFDNEKFINDLS